MTKQEPVFLKKKATELEMFLTTSVKFKMEWALHPTGIKFLVCAMHTWPIKLIESLQM